MSLKKISKKPKVFLLMIGVCIIIFLSVTGRLFQKEKKDCPNTEIANEELLILGTEKTIDGLGEMEVYTDRGIYKMRQKMDLEPYIYQSVQAVTEEKELIHINNLLQRQVKLKNCLIVKNNRDELRVFSEGYFVTLPCKDLQADFRNQIADIYITNGSVTKISAKKECISGKILSVRADGIEVSGYGLVPMDEKFRFYETYGDYAEKPAQRLIVGNDRAKFIVAEGKICAAIIEEPIVTKKIRVLLKTTGFEELVHQSVELKAHGNYEISYNGKKELLEDGQELSLTSVSDYFSQERVTFTPQNVEARMEIKSIERAMGSPVYAGSIEVMRSDGGLMIINEVDIETYLCGVVPSEMPARYELEALKAQAVCARSYALRQILLNGYAAYGAHVDDSVSYQVYQNLPADDKVIKAVWETAGKVLQFQGETALTYYFSTSCGHTTNETIWKNGSLENSYLSGKLLNDTKEKLDLTEEDAFRDFILQENYETYDSGEEWYRWDMTVSLKQLEKNVFTEKNIGNICDLKVTKRNEGGVVQEVLVEGEKDSLLLETEHQIRTVLNGEGVTIKRIHGKDVSGGKMLPSGFFVIDPVKEDGQLTGFRFRGGGFGHGAGMSQNGANHMAESGKNYEEILALFFDGTVLENIGYH